MNESLYSIKDFFDFWRKCEWVFNIFKKIFWTIIIFGAIFCLIFIPLHDQNPTSIAGLIILILSTMLAVIIDDYGIKKQTVIFCLGLTSFIYSYFLIIPLDNNISFLTDNSCKLKSYGSYQLFHIPIYDKHFIYKNQQQRSFDDIYGNFRIIIDLEFDFDELFKYNEQVLVFRESFDAMIDKKTETIKLFIINSGLPKNLEKIKSLNDPWLKITSLKIEFKSITIQ